MKNDPVDELLMYWRQSDRDPVKFAQLLREHTEPVPGQAQEEAPAVLAGASTKPTWDHVLNKLYQLEARLAALERET